MLTVLFLDMSCPLIVLHLTMHLGILMPSCPRSIKSIWLQKRYQVSSNLASLVGHSGILIHSAGMLYDTTVMGWGNWAYVEFCLQVRTGDA